MRPVEVVLYQPRLLITCMYHVDHGYSLPRAVTAIGLLVVGILSFKVKGTNLSRGEDFLGPTVLVGIAGYARAFGV